MTSVSTSLRSLSRRIGATLAVTLLALGVTGAHAENRPRGETVALAYDAATDTLLKAGPGVLQRSSNGGQSWEPVALPPSGDDGAIAAVAVPANAANVLYVAGPGLGVLRSADGGGTWVARNQGLPSQDVAALTTHADLPDTLYVFVPEHGIYRSEDAGESWRLMDQAQGGIRQFIHSDMAGSMETGWLFAATPQGVRRSMDCFCLWRDAGDLSGPIDSITFDPRQPEHLYAAVGADIFHSAKGGEHWEQMASPSPGIAALTVTPSGELYAITGDGALYRSTDQAKTWGPADA